MALLCLFVVSTLAAGVMYSTQSEIWTTGNYRATTQARYIAEAGAQQALNYLQSGAYSPAFLAANLPSFGTSMPLMYNAQPVILATAGMPSQYADTYKNFDNTTDGTFQNYFAPATTQQPFSSISSGAKFEVAVQLLSAVVGVDNKWLTRWKIVSQGTLNSVGTSTTSGKARVQIVEIVDNVTYVGSTAPGGSQPNYIAGVFATSTGCNAITMSGGQFTNSFDSSSSGGSSSPAFTGAQGDIATYGNVSVTNGAYVVGNVFTPGYNLGATGTYGISGGGTWPGLNAPQTGPYSYGSPPPCSTATGGTEWAVNEDNSGSGVGCTAQSSGSCSQKTFALPSPVPSYPTPAMPSPQSVPSVPVNTATCSGYNGLCSGGSGGGSGCAITVPPSFLPNGNAGTGATNFGAVNFGSCAVITLQAGTYNMDSLYISNGAKVIVPTTGNVIINILDNGTANPPLSVDGGTVANNGGSPSALTFIYAGSKPINLTAGANMFASVYAPNSKVTVGGNAGLFGALVSNSTVFNGSGHVIYDTNLGKSKWPIYQPPSPQQFTGALHIDEFSWSAY